FLKTYWFTKLSFVSSCFYTMPSGFSVVLLPYTQYVAALQVFWLFFCIPSICVYVPDILFPFVVQMCLHFLMPSPPILAQCALDISIAATKLLQGKTLSYSLWTLSTMGYFVEMG
uniref:Uncharacterized protein n=1 Tax=Aegilops tauschii subsp. strangulata TaxID=200361 RepID=A0A453S769_AEGTS